MHLSLSPPVLHFVPPLLTAAFAFALGVALAHGSVLQVIPAGCAKFGACIRLWRWRHRRGDACTATGVGNPAFDDHRRETLRKLENEAREFRVFLDGLKQAADAADFEAFLKARREQGAQRP